MTTTEYSSGVVNDAFWYAATKETAKYLAAGMTPDEIKERALQNNLYQCKTPARFTRIYGTIMRRLQAIPKEAVAALAESTLSTGKSIILLSIMRTDQLFCELIAEVFTPKLRQGDFDLTKKDVNAFFSYKAQQSEVVGNWSDQTILRMKRAYIGTLVDAGLIMQEKNGWKCYFPLIDPTIKQIFANNGMKSYITALLGDAA